MLSYFSDVFCVTTIFLPELVYVSLLNAWPLDISAAGKTGLSKITVSPATVPVNMPVTEAITLGVYFKVIE